MKTIENGAHWSYKIKKFCYNLNKDTIKDPAYSPETLANQPFLSRDMNAENTHTKEDTKIKSKNNTTKVS